jgi:type I restriction enzyme S subunit
VEGIQNSVKVNEGDLILSNSATPGLPKFVGLEACIHDGWLLLSNFKEVEKDYLYYLLLAKQKELIHSARGTVFKNLKTDIVRDLEISLPPLPEQKRIANILSSFDNKIELLREQNKTLENIAQTIFKQWFIDFNFPDSNGKPYKDSGGKMVDSELGMIPEGWKVEALSSITELIMGQSPPSASYNEDRIGLPLLNGAEELTKTKVLKSKYTTEPTRVSQTGDILFCIRATIGNIHFSDTDYCLGRGVAALRPLEDLGIFVFYLLKDSLSKISKQASGSVIKGLTKKMIQSFKLPYHFGTAGLFNQKIKPLQEKTKLNEESIERLRSARNILLNKLIL